MTTKKRWNRIYEDANPLSLPQKIRKQMRKGGQGSKANVRFLWLILSGDSAEPETDRWLNVIDESAAVGAETLIVSVAGSLDGRTYVWDALHWACDSHDMYIGLHLFTPEISSGDLDRMAKLDSENFCLFVCSRYIDDVRKQVGENIRVVEADGLADGAPQLQCTLPKEMTCVSSGGEMYTCGLVAGQDGFFLGDCNDARIDHVALDGSLPHHVPAGTSDAPNRCEGCPPLLQARLQEALRK